jgi:hypothetical protein
MTNESYDTDKGGKKVEQRYKKLKKEHKQIGKKKVEKRQTDD